MCANIQKIKYPAWQQGKSVKTKLQWNNGITIDLTIIDPGDLIHMDKAESSTPGRSLTYSDKITNKKYLFYLCL